MVNKEGRYSISDGGLMKNSTHLSAAFCISLCSMPYAQWYWLMNPLISNLGLRPAGPAYPDWNELFFLFVKYIAYFLLNCF